MHTGHRYWHRREGWQVTEPAASLGDEGSQPASQRLAASQPVASLGDEAS